MVTLPVVVVLSLFVNLIVLLAFYTDSGNVLHLLLLISFCEAIVPTAIIAHIPFLINANAGTFDTGANAPHGQTARADDDDEEDEDDGGDDDEGDDDLYNVPSMSLEKGAAGTYMSSPRLGKKKYKEKTQLCSVHMVFASMGISDAAIVMVGIAFLGYTLDHHSTNSWGINILFFFSAFATFLAFVLLLAETFEVVFLLSQ